MSLCEVSGCSRGTSTDRNGVQRSKLCSRHATHYKRHGHATLKQPSLRSNLDIRVPYLAGERWARHADISKLTKWFEYQFQNAKDYHVSPYRHKRELTREQLWVLHLNHLDSLHVTSNDLAIRLVGLLWACKMNESLFKPTDFRYIFLTKKLLTIKPLPSHNKDAYTGKGKPYGELSIRFARWVGVKLEDACNGLVEAQREVLMEINASTAKQVVSNKKAQSEIAHLASIRQRIRTQKKRVACRKLMWDMTNNQYYWQYSDGTLEPV